MSKRRRPGLGGGTGDINPQWFNMNVNTLAATYSDTATPMPVQRLNNKSNSMVMEVLKIEFGIGGTQTIVPTAATAASLRWYLTTTSFGTTEPTVQQVTGKVLGRARIDVLAAAGSAGQSAIDTLKLVDLTDGAGHGILAATDSLFLGTIQTGATNPSTAGTGTCRILYRWKNVGLAEYIGIVQSQQ